MNANKFLLKEKGKGFVISLHGEGDSCAAKVVIFNAFGRHPKCSQLWSCGPR